MFGKIFENSDDILNDLTIFSKEYLIDLNNFFRITTVEKSQNLQIDFVNDRIKRFGKIIVKDQINLDNPLNILSNKITAVISRDNPKDIFDIYLISLKENFNKNKK